MCYVNWFLNNLWAMPFLLTLSTHRLPETSKFSCTGMSWNNWFYLIQNISYREHATPLLWHRQWLLISFQTHFRLLIMTYRILYDFRLGNLKGCVLPYKPAKWCCLFNPNWNKSGGVMREKEVENCPIDLVCSGNGLVCSFFWWPHDVEPSWISLSLIFVYPRF